METGSKSRLPSTRQPYFDPKVAPPSRRDTYFSQKVVSRLRASPTFTNWTKIHISVLGGKTRTHAFLAWVTPLGPESMQFYSIKNRQKCMCFTNEKWNRVKSRSIWSKSRLSSTRKPYFHPKVSSRLRPRPTFAKNGPRSMYLSMKMEKSSLVYARALLWYKFDRKVDQIWAWGAQFVCIFTVGAQPRARKHAVLQYKNFTEIMHFTIKK